MDLVYLRRLTFFRIVVGPLAIDLDGEGGGAVATRELKEKEHSERLTLLHRRTQISYQWNYNVQREKE